MKKLQFITDELAYLNFPINCICTVTFETKKFLYIKNEQGQELKCGKILLDDYFIYI